MTRICITGTGYFGAWRERVRQLAKALDLEYSGELVSGVTTILVVAESQSESCAELLLGPKARTAMQWGDIDIVRHQWLEDSAQHGALCDLEAYTLVPKKLQEASTVEKDRPADGRGSVPATVLGSSQPTATAEAGAMLWEDSPEVPRYLSFPKPHAPVLGDLYSFGSPAKLKQHGPHSRPPSLLRDQSGAVSSPLHLEKSMMRAAGTRQEMDVSQPQASLELGQHAGSSGPVPKPLQMLLGYAEEASSDSPAHDLPGDAESSGNHHDDSASPEPDLEPLPVKVTASHRLKKASRHSTAPGFHHVPEKSITHYDKLTVQHPELDAPLGFCLHDRSHCALVHYDDSADGKTRELAYAQLLSCYKLATDGRIYIEHKYLYDADDIKQQRAGSAFLQQYAMADSELVDCPEVYHSLAEVIDGEFWLTTRAVAQGSQYRTQGSGPGMLQPMTKRLCLFCECSWDRVTGSRLGEPFDGKNT